MAAQGKKSTAVASTTVKALRFLIVVSSVALFLVPGNVQLHFAKASTSCVTDGEVCFDDDTCTACVTSIASTGASQSECAEQYSLDTETGDDVCGLFGVAYCCSAELSGQECLTDETTLAYWSCALQNLGCTLDDMPCLDGATDIAVDGSTDVAADDSGAVGMKMRSCSIPTLAGALGLLVTVAGTLV